MDKVSVIMPVFNSAKYLKRSIESVLNQTYKNLELIIIDDGSTDNSLEVILQYSAKDNRIKVYQNNNSGPGEARNIGINNSTGEFIQFIDADDQYETNMIKEMYTNLTIMDSDIIICDYENITEEGERKTYSINSSKKSIVKKQNKNNYDEMLIKLYDAKLLFAVWNKMYRTDIIKNNNIFFPSLSLGEDALFNLSFLRCSSSIVYLKETLYNYYYNNTSIMNNYKVNQFVVQMEIYNSLKCTLLNTSHKSFLDTVGSDFLVEVVYGVVNLSNRKCKYNYKEKYQKILKIINNETAREIIKDGNNSSLFIKILQTLIKNEKKAILFLLVNLNFLRFFTKM